MRFANPLIPGRLIRRYKRFLADVELDAGGLLTAHCPNSGSMLGCDEPGSPVLLSRSDNPGRKYPHTLELVRVGETWVGINTSRTNGLVAEGIAAGVVKELAGATTIRPEVRVSQRSRLDFLLTIEGAPVYLEVKNCTLAVGRAAMFPDAVTTRGARHLEELLALRRNGQRAVVLFCVQREDVQWFSPASHLDPAYAEGLRIAMAGGVEALAYRAILSPEEIRLAHRLEVRVK
ncbi:MAG: DNA/RNA nuclease SfsA [Thermodesulfobacteriota bacterium]